MHIPTNHRLLHACSAPSNQFFLAVHARCKWRSESFSAVSRHKPLPDKVVKKLRQVAQAPAPTFRPSIKCVCVGGWVLGV